MRLLYTLLSRGLLAFLLLVALPQAARSQTPNWQSAQAVAVATAAFTGTYSAVSATAVDAAGNVFLVGYFTNSVVLGGTTLTSLGDYDVFVAKFNPANNQFVWAQRAGGTRSDRAYALAVSGTSVYVAGHFAGYTAGFGPTTLTNAGNSFTSDAFVAKLTDTGPTGSFIWAQRAGGSENDYAYALAASGTNVYVAGYFDSPTAGFGTTSLTNAGSEDVFVAKLIDAGSTGSFTWAQRAGGSGTDNATALAISGTSVYVAGHFDSTATAFGTTMLTNAGNSDMFVAKLTDTGPTGSFIWAQRAGGLRYEKAYALAVSGSNVYVAGCFDSPTVVFGNTTLTTAGSFDAVVAKLTDTGSFVWAQRAGGSGTDYAYALAMSGSNVYVAGYFDSPTAGFGPTTLTNASNSFISDVFVAKLTDTGPASSFAWAQRAGGSDHDWATALAVSGTSVYVSGVFYTTSNFGTTIVTNPTPNTLMSFFAALTDPTLTAVTAARLGAQATLFPNPASRTATLRLPAGAAPTLLTLTDALGHAVRHYPNPTGPEATLDLLGLPAGLYLLRGAGPAQRLVVE